MHLIYTTRRRGFEPGRQYRNPRFFAGADKAATSVTVEGHHPDVVAAYEAAGIEIEVIGAEEPRPDDAESDERARRAELMDAIEQTTGKRPGANTKTETLEQRMAEIESSSQDEDGQE
ncbi:hypothetical protein KUV74_12485 [Halomonas sp. DP1Y21-3]|uniref:hypothetical protein n=1 Tax=Halomonas sp. DP1Y21-3 TaxID=2859080 RepID=UPI001C96E17F|nr:hypothetical protein [Halomonas sp. DP1Y21-3]MBY6111211.1 hypothetical protein [Halomonas sp. DP1Y21-3]